MIHYLRANNSQPPPGGLGTAYLRDRLAGGLWGALMGDALGVPVEFQGRSERALDPVRGPRGYGTHGQPAGTWSDDGALLLCSAVSLVEKGFDLEDMGARFVRWATLGHWAAHGTVFDIGIATRKALLLIEHGCAAEAAGGSGVNDNGNGSLMRILPVPLASLTLDDAEFCSRIERASSITHGHERSKLACVFHGLLVRALIYGHEPAEALELVRTQFATRYASSAELVVFSALIYADLASLPAAEILSSGYVLHTLTASIWCLLTTSSFSECVLQAVNLGDDTDTTGCVAGGLAGLVYGFQSIPGDWLATLPRQEEVHSLVQRFVTHCSASS